MLIDTHCHLDHPPLDAVAEEALTRAQEAGVRQCLTVSVDEASSRANIKLAQRYPELRVAVGVHPHDADSVTDEILAGIERLSGEPKVAAIGEVGLDYYRKCSSPDNQRRVFMEFMKMAQRKNLPLVIHCREAYEELLELLQRHAARPQRGVIHCASGPTEFIEGALSLGMHVSFAGNVTFENAKDLQALVPNVPGERLLLETDAPFLTPEPKRGKMNEPAFLKYTAAFVARIRGVTEEAIAELTTRNACELFGFTV